VLATLEGIRISVGCLNAPIISIFEIADKNDIDCFGEIDS